MLKTGPIFSGHEPYIMPKSILASEVLEDYISYTNSESIHPKRYVYSVRHRTFILHCRESQTL